MSASDSSALSGMDAFKAQMKKAVAIFVAMDLIFIAGAVVLYFSVFQPEMAKVQAARDEAVRAGIAAQARIRAIEARYALTVMDVPGAEVASRDVATQLSGLLARVPADRTQEAAEVKQLHDRAALLPGAFGVDPNSARKDLEIIEAKLAVLYPAVSPQPPARK